MEQYISKSALVAEIERRIKHYNESAKEFGDEGYNDNVLMEQCKANACEHILSFLNTLEVKDPYEQCIQYASIESGIKAHAEVYSFNIESELFNQLTKEQQALWRKEIEQTCISGGYNGLDLAKDQRYKDTLEVKEVDLEKELIEWHKKHFKKDRTFIGMSGFYLTNNSQMDIAKHFFEFGMRINNPITAADRGMAEKFISDCTRDCYNYSSYAQDPIPWLTPDQARRAVEIAREEMIEKACKWLKDYKSPLEELGLHIFIDDGFINDFKQAMRDE